MSSTCTPGCSVQEMEIITLYTALTCHKRDKAVRQLWFWNFWFQLQWKCKHQHWWVIKREPHVIERALGVGQQRGRQPSTGTCHMAIVWSSGCSPSDCLHGVECLTPGWQQMALERAFNKLAEFSDSITGDNDSGVDTSWLWQPGQVCVSLTNN